ncbi:MAG: reverse transcriptase family protein, partial [Pseudomonadota bacterium]
MNIIRSAQITVTPHETLPSLDNVQIGRKCRKVPVSFNRHDADSVPVISHCTAAGSVKIEPGHLCFVRAHINNISANENCHFSPDSSFFAKKGVIGAETLVQQSQQGIKIPVFNPTDKPVYIRRQSKLGEALPVAINSETDVGEPEGLPSTSADSQTSWQERQEELLRKLADPSISINESEKSQFLQTFLLYPDIVSLFDFDVGRYTAGEHTIETEGPPIRLKSRPTPVHHSKQVKEIIENNLKHGIISPSCSPWSAPIVIALKKNGKLRLCVDYRKLNAVTKKDVYVIPRIQDILDSLSGSKYFISLDLASGYWQIPLAENDREKTAFICEHGLYEFNVLPFGLCNAPSSFQRIMDTVLRGITGVFVYIDDIIISGKTFEETCARFKQVAERLREANLKINLTKSSFFKTSMDFLGHIVSAEGVKPSDDKAEAVKKFPVPRSADEVRSFYGLCSFYRNFVFHFAEIAEPLQKLMRKNATFVWSKECQKAFETLKAALTGQPLLAYPDFDTEFIVYTDASNFGLRVVIAQVQGGREHVIYFASRLMTDPELKYTIGEKEALAIIFACTKFRKYLLGRKFKLITDHTALKALRDKQNINSARLERWALFLSQFEYEVVYKQGILHHNADALSRLIPGKPSKPDSPQYMRLQSHAATQTNESDGDNQCSATSALTSVSINRDIIRSEQDKDIEISQMKSFLAHGIVPNDSTQRDMRMKTIGCEIVDGILQLKSKRSHPPRICIPPTLRKDIGHRSPARIQWECRLRIARD